MGSRGNAFASGASIVRNRREMICPKEIIMGTAQSNPAGPDLERGIPADDLPDGRMLAGHVGEEAVLLARRGDEFFAIGATCSHYSGPLAEGIVVEDTVRCPWHHACFSLRTGEALHAPALSPVACWSVERRDGRIFVAAQEGASAAKKGRRRPAGGRIPGHNCDHRRRSGGLRRRRETASRTISGKRRHAERR